MALALRIVSAEEVARFRLDPLIEEEDGVLYLVLNGEANDNGDHLKSPFNPHGVNGMDDGDPHFFG